MATIPIITSQLTYSRSDPSESRGSGEDGGVIAVRALAWARTHAQAGEGHYGAGLGERSHTCASTHAPTLVSSTATLFSLSRSAAAFAPWGVGRWWSGDDH